MKPSHAPVASLERLLEVGLDPVRFGTCSKPTEEKIPGRGNVITNQGCEFWHDCPMAKIPMPDHGAMRPRPRLVKTRLIKPSHDGKGDAIRENYCTCAQWNAGLKRRNGVNGEIAEICGGEGDPVLLMGSKLVTKDEAGNPITPYYKPTYWKKDIPAFPDPEDSEELLRQTYASASRKSDAQRGEQEIQADRDRRMASRGVGIVPADAGDSEEASLDDIKANLAGEGSEGA